MSIYSEIILDHYHAPHNHGEIKSPDLEKTIVNSSCGDKIRFTVTLQNDKIADIKFSGEGCAISIASASMLTDAVKGKTIKSIQKLQSKDVITLLSIDLSPNRLKCALLPLEGIQQLSRHKKNENGK